ncbi:hypothetical protein F5X99DRAFT_411394 [Biscogniauxia marginata]|nr:hypothetical protein F5X99DRAFT_411394 [Biscogniauxia marginata]
MAAIAAWEASSDTSPSDGRERSTPATRYSPARKDGIQRTGDVLTSFPRQAHDVTTDFISEYLPELVEERVNISSTRICWYTDSFDSHFVVDWVPGSEGFIAATGGSGHAFKYLPNIGNWVADVMENIGADRAVIQAWRWREVGLKKPANDLRESSKGSRALGNIQL